jgi:hypothetical protein
VLQLIVANPISPAEGWERLTLLEKFFPHFGEAYTVYYSKANPRNIASIIFVTLPAVKERNGTALYAIFWLPCAGLAIIHNALARYFYYLNRFISNFLS